jgi:serine protease Do
MNHLNDEIVMLQAIERYLDGTMLPDEKVYFEQLRKNTPEIDQMVVEHSMFLHQIEGYSQNRSLKQSLQNIHQNLLHKGDINEGGNVPLKAKVIQFFATYKRDMMVAASVGGLIATIISVFLYTLTPTNDTKIQQLSKELANVKKTVNVQNSIINDVKTKLPQGSTLLSGGTGFLIDANGFIITNTHILKGNGAIVVDNEGKEYNAKIVYRDAATDLAILRITDTDFNAQTNLPYSIDKTNADLGEEIFTLGYPKNDITYTQGYLSSKTGIDGDTASYQIQMNSNPGNSGGPVLNKEGKVIGVLSAKQTKADGVTFAVKSKKIYQLVERLAETDTALQRIKLPIKSTLNGKTRENQVKKIEDCVFLVKAYNN